MTDTPIIDAVPGELAPALDANLAAMFRSFALVLGGELDERDALSRHHCSPSNPMFKGVWGLSLADSDADAEIDATIAWFRARQAPFAFWWSGTSSRPTDLAVRLEARGIDAFEREAPVMAADLDALAETPPPPEALDIDWVEDERGLDRWAATFVEAYGVPAFAARGWADATRTAGYGAAPWKLVTATLAGEPAGCGILFCGGGVANLIGLGTIERYRRRGIGTALQRARIDAARARGYRHAVLFASELGYSPYRRLGFVDTGARISRHLWRAG